jgi:uncharacterized protein (TIGR00251 family)
LNAKLRVKVRPQAGRSKIVGFLGNGILRVDLKDPPERGKANQGLVDLLSRKTGIPKDSIHIVSGRTRRAKLVSFDGISELKLKERLS